MTAVQLPQLAGEQLVAFVLVMARVGGIFLFAPAFSSRLIPARVKLIVAGVVSLAMMPMVADGAAIPTEPVAVTTLIVKEAVVGLAFALAVGVIVGAVQAAASLIDTVVGFSFAAIVDPMSNVQGAVLGQLYSVFTVMIFLVTGGDHLLFMGLASSYELLPLASVPDLAVLGSLATDHLADIFVIGLEIAAPVLLALLLVEAGLALVARAVPQMNVFVVGMPAKILVGFAVVAASLPFVAGHIQMELEELVRAGLTGLGA
jgi:flagellar biosynthetic protein FliR